MLSFAVSLAQLEHADLIRRLRDPWLRAGDEAYQFKHNLIQESAYASLLKNDRRHLHRACAQAIERAYPNNLDEYAALLAKHFAEAGDDAKTFEYSTRAGDLAARVFAYPEALTHYARALEIANANAAAPPERIRLVTRYGRTLEVIGRYAEALALYQDQTQRAQASGDRALELAMLSARAILHSAPMAVFDGALSAQLHDQALALARALQDRAAEAQILWSLTLLNTHQMHLAEALQYGEQALALAHALQAEGLDMRERVAYAQHELALPYAASGQLARALELNSASQTAWRTLDNAPMLIDSIGVAANLALVRGVYTQALTLTAEAAELSETIGNEFGWLYTQSMRTQILIELGEWTAAWTLGRQVLARSQDSATIHFMMASFIAHFLAEMGAFDAAAEIERAAPLVNRNAIPDYLGARGNSFRARSKLLRRDRAAAARELEPLPDRAALPAPISLALPEVWFAHIELALAYNDLERARWLAENVCAEFERLGAAGTLAEGLYLYGVTLRGLNRFDDANAMWQRARALCQANDRRRLLWQIYVALSESEKARGNVAQADALQRQARAVIDWLTAHAPPEFRESFRAQAAARAR